MYAETGLLFPYFQNYYSQELQQFEEFSQIQKINASTSNLVQSSTVSEYNLGGEGDLFKAPEPIIEEPTIGLDPMAAAISMLSCGEDIISPQAIKVVDIESIQSEHLLNEVFYGCKNDLLEKSAIGLFPPDVKIPAVCMEEDSIAEKERLFSEGPIQKSVSSGCLISKGWMHGSGDAMRVNLLDFQGMDFETAYGMRRAFSEGDIQTLGNGNTRLIHCPLERPVTIGNYTIEERRQMLSRYRNKKTKRNFGRKIKYACRKALAENQPRVRGRFAKAEESEFPKK